MHSVLLCFVFSLYQTQTVISLDLPQNSERLVNVSTSATAKIEKLFTKHPRKEEHKINEKYVKHLQHEIESKHMEIG